MRGKKYQIGLELWASEKIENTGACKIVLNQLKFTMENSSLIFCLISYFSEIFSIKIYFKEIFIYWPDTNCEISAVNKLNWIEYFYINKKII